eukprot:CAMPEP_0195010148 /NCGR_PEP_ID=MMETSP0326_2-20130528/9877_1 /TAXON_ID=2866 ORGANISM="Crypthecodinium cohnii, Strain Seligo" /NCGR_SAMPLE_ID=MMETSP0326_2 /ASSEMBLY_ACC=CAM_ASM_000348 /LENGTH=187 /DNA_ID=CAMNT_0040018683 /DNA_START=112 /DNA_END=672 /DNA_ORIENTATION=-
MHEEQRWQRGFTLNQRWNSKGRASKQAGTSATRGGERAMSNNETSRDSGSILNALQDSEEQGEDVGGGSGSQRILKERIQQERGLRAHDGLNKGQADMEGVGRVVVLCDRRMNHLGGVVVGEFLSMHPTGMLGNYRDACCRAKEEHFSTKSNSLVLGLKARAGPALIRSRIPKHVDKLHKHTHTHTH